MPNGTYGGVRGEAGDGFTYSIQASRGARSRLTANGPRTPPVASESKLSKR